MISFKARHLLTVYFLCNAVDAFMGHNITKGIFDLILGLCLLTCCLGRPFSIGPIEFGGW